jgi:hypothetical protein
MNVYNLFIGTSSGFLTTKAAVFLSTLSGNVLYTGYTTKIKTTSYTYTIGYLMEYTSTNVLDTPTTTSISFSYQTFFLLGSITYGDAFYDYNEITSSCSTQVKKLTTSLEKDLLTTTAVTLPTAFMT